MRILQLCIDMFNETPKDISIKEFFHKMRKKENSKKGNDDNTDKGFFVLCSNYLGGRGYNEFLDFSLFVIKLNTIYDRHCRLEQKCSWDDISEAITNLLGDDRHDMYQNVPYNLINVAKGLSPEKEKVFWADIVDAMIDCINVQGTGDISVNFVIKEE